MRNHTVTQITCQGISKYFSGKNKEALAASVAYQLEERAVHTGIVGQLGMKRGSHSFTLTNDHGIAAFGGQNFDIAAQAGDFWRTNEHHLDWRSSKKTFANRTINLAPVGIAANADVESAEACLLGVLYFVCEEDRARTGTERRFFAHESFQLFESCFAEKFKKSAGFSTRNNQSVNFVELLGFLDEHNFGAEFFEPPAVSVEVPLQGQDADFYIGC